MSNEEIARCRGRSAPPAIHHRRHPPRRRGILRQAPLWGASLFLPVALAVQNVGAKSRGVEIVGDRRQTFVADRRHDGVAVRAIKGIATRTATIASAIPQNRRRSGANRGGRPLRRSVSDYWFSNAPFGLTINCGWSEKMLANLRYWCEVRVLGSTHFMSEEIPRATPPLSRKERAVAAKLTPREWTTFAPALFAPDGVAQSVRDRTRILPFSRLARSQNFSPHSASRRAVRPVKRRALWTNVLRSGEVRLRGRGDARLISSRARRPVWSSRTC
jgi:hypothetical protein